MSKIPFGPDVVHNVTTSQGSFTTVRPKTWPWSLAPTVAALCAMPTAPLLAPSHHPARQCQTTASSEAFQSEVPKRHDSLFNLVRPAHLCDAGDISWTVGDFPGGPALNTGWAWGFSPGEELDLTHAATKTRSSQMN